MVTLQLAPKPAPSLTETIRALTDYGTTDEALDLLTATEWVTQTHIGSTHELPDGTYGPCQLCEQPWPCPAWEEIRTLTLHWLVRSSTITIHVSRERIRGTT